MKITVFWNVIPRSPPHLRSAPVKSFVFFPTHYASETGPLGPMSPYSVSPHHHTPSISSLSHYSSHLYSKTGLLKTIDFFTISFTLIGLLTAPTLAVHLPTSTSLTHSAHSSTLKTEATYSSEMSVNIYQDTYHHIPRDYNLYSHCCENLT
jgi:hypothetical protein